MECDTIHSPAQSGTIVICCGGGGILVIRSGDGTFVPIEGVIDKDLVAAQLALDVGARRMLILTAVGREVLNMGKLDHRRVWQVTAAELKAWFGEKQFPTGSMGPKIEAALRFLMGGGREAIITMPETARAALDGKAATRILR